MFVLIGGSGRRGDCRPGVPVSLGGGWRGSSRLRLLNDSIGASGISIKFGLAG